MINKKRVIKFSNSLVKIVEATQEKKKTRKSHANRFLLNQSSISMNPKSLSKSPLTNRTTKFSIEDKSPQ
jgi:hypothetical protein